MKPERFEALPSASTIKKQKHKGKSEKRRPPKDSGAVKRAKFSSDSIVDSETGTLKVPKSQVRQHKKSEKLGSGYPTTNATANQKQKRPTNKVGVVNSQFFLGAL